MTSFFSVLHYKRLLELSNIDTEYILSMTNYIMYVYKHVIVNLEYIFHVRLKNKRKSQIAISVILPSNENQFFLNVKPEMNKIMVNK